MVGESGMDAFCVLYAKDVTFCSCYSLIRSRRSEKIYDTCNEEQSDPNFFVVPTFVLRSPSLLIKAQDLTQWYPSFPPPP
jgi:hypothetical protein